jgi:hypothetical protein
MTNQLKTISWYPRLLYAIIALSLAVFVALLLVPPEGRAQTPNPSPAAVPSPSKKELSDWQSEIVRIPSPKMGCFTSSYPSTQWQEVPCTSAPTRLYPPARGRGSDHSSGLGAGGRQMSGTAG